MRVLAWIVAAILIAPLAAALEDPNRALRPSLVAARSAIPSPVGGPHLMSPDPHVGSWPAGTAQGSPLVGPRASPVGAADILVLLIEFTDVVHEPTHDQTFFDRFLNDSSPGAPSMRAFYAEASYGALTINATIVPMWFVSSRTMSYYGQDGSSAASGWEGGGFGHVLPRGVGSGARRGPTPAMFSAWSKIRLGWLTPTYGPFDFAADTPIPAIETHAFVYRLPTVVSPSEYFLIENREPIHFDAALPAHGLLIWHVDDSRPNNNDDAHRILDLEEMDEGVNGDRPTDAGDPWHDTAVGFGPDTNPSSFAYGPIPTKWRGWDYSATCDAP